MMAHNGIDRKNLTWAPVLEDMEDWWITIQTYVGHYLHLYYPDDKHLLQDTSVCKWYSEVGKIVKGSTNYPQLSDAPDACQQVIDCISVIIYVSTVFHEVAGSDSYRMCNPYVISTRWRKGKTLEERISPLFVALRARNVGLATTIRSPVYFTDWSYMAAPPRDKSDEEKDRHEKVVKLMKDYKGEMAAVGDRIKGRNKYRVYPLPMLLPENLECSIAV